MRLHWFSYYKWLQKGVWSWRQLALQFLQLVLQHHDKTEKVRDFIIDDTLVLRSSKKAPGSQKHHQHGQKTNLATYVLSQSWVHLSMVLKRTHSDTFTSVPVMARLMGMPGQTTKLNAAKALLRAIYTSIKNGDNRVLVDCWYRRQTFIEYALKLRIQVIGQVRRDTKLTQ